MKWKSFRPAAMLIEKSYNYQRSWQVSRYYAKRCAASFPGAPVIPPQNISMPYCTEKYSDIEPSSGGEVRTNGLLKQCHCFFPHCSIVSFHCSIPLFYCLIPLFHSIVPLFHSIVSFHCFIPLFHCFIPLFHLFIHGSN